MHGYNRISQRSDLLSDWLGLLGVVIGNFHRVAFVMVSTDVWPIPRHTTFVKEAKPCGQVSVPFHESCTFNQSRKLA